MRLKEEGERKDEKIRASEVKIEELMGYTDSIDDKLRSIEGNLISLREDNRLKEERIGELEREREDWSGSYEAVLKENEKMDEMAVKCRTYQSHNEELTKRNHELSSNNEKLRIQYGNLEGQIQKYQEN